MQITERIHSLKHIFKIPVNPEINIDRFVYSFIIFGEKKVYLIDSGVADSGNTIIKYILKEGAKTENIEVLFLTHAHPDHIGSAKQIKDLSNCTILANENEKEWIEDIDKQFKDRPVPGFKNLVGGSVTIDRFLYDNDIIELEDNLKLKVIYTPGHSQGSISLFEQSEGILFCGDSILLPGELPIYENFEDTIASIKKLQKIHDARILLSSWDEPVYSNSILEKLDESIKYLFLIHETIKEINNENKYQPLELCKRVVEKMGLPTAALNPLVAKSFQSNVRVLYSVT
jgi:hydroxyacylglutathione hydrolase